MTGLHCTIYSAHSEFFFVGFGHLRKPRQRAGNTAWLPNKARSMWDALRGGAYYDAHTTLAQIMCHCSRNCANLKQIPYPLLTTRIGRNGLANQITIGKIQSAHSKKLNNDPTCGEISQRVTF